MTRETRTRLGVPVLIAGGSLVGMSTAMLLGGHGISSLVVERHPGAAIHPRAAFLLQRTMEILRGAGVEAQVRDRSHAQFEPDAAGFRDLADVPSDLPPGVAC
jgi:2-polyprenyl-6-methoxyphenol hydroxylase-like FAD-dependent oxidoreductase